MFMTQRLREFCGPIAPNKVTIQLATSPFLQLPEPFKFVQRKPLPDKNDTFAVAFREYMETDKLPKVTRFYPFIVKGMEGLGLRFIGQ